MSNQKRQPAGQPIGGQFAATTRAESAVGLTAPAAGVDEAPCARCDALATGADGLCDRHTARWGKVDIREGSRTPWGAADHVTRVAPGIVIADTPSHGGVKLSPERNALIPPALRNRSGWYEEDCEINIPLTYFSEEWAAQDWVKKSADEVRADADRGVKDWFPDKWEAANGREIEPGESHTKDQAMWAARHADEPVVSSSSTAESDPEMVVVTATVKTTGEEAEFLVPKSEYETRHDDDGDPGRNRRFIVDPSRHPKLPPKQETARPVEQVVHVDEDRISGGALSQAYIDGSITQTARDRIANDLAKQWRSHDGQVRSMRDILTGGAVSKKTAYVDGASMKYAVLQPTPDGTGHYSLQVSKATWDYLDMVDDDRSPASRAQQESSAYRERISRKPGGPTQKEFDRMAELQTVATQLREQEDAERVAREGTWQEKDAARRLAQAERERAARIND